MQVKVVKLGDDIRTVNIPDKGATVADVLRAAGEDPSDLGEFTVRLTGESGEPELERPVKPWQTLSLVPNVAGGG